MDNEDLSRGKGDPDVYGYPGQTSVVKYWVGTNAPVVEYTIQSINRRDFYPWSETDYDPNFDEDLEEDNK